MRINNWEYFSLRLHFPSSINILLGLDFFFSRSVPAWFMLPQDRKAGVKLVFKEAAENSPIRRDSLGNAEQVGPLPWFLGREGCHQGVVLAEGGVKGAWWQSMHRGSWGWKESLDPLYFLLSSVMPRICPQDCTTEKAVGSAFNTGAVLQSHTSCLLLQLLFQRGSQNNSGALTTRLLYKKLGIPSVFNASSRCIFKKDTVAVSTWNTLL